MAKTTFTYDEFKSNFKTVTNLKKKAKEYSAISLYPATITGKIKKTGTRGRIMSFQYSKKYDGWVYLGTMSVYNTTRLINKIIPLMYKHYDKKMLIVFKKNPSLSDF